VLTAANDQEAAKIAAEYPGPIHLVVTDILIPGMNGRELAQYLSSERPELKVLFVSGYPDDALTHRGILDARHAFLPKPFTPDVLDRKIREVLHQLPPLDP
jgi:DNA-binding NarL/FixJ family response regulator